MSEKCQFCGASVWYIKDGDGAFECRTTLDYSWRSSECKVATCARYESLFPVFAMDESPITRDVCRKLGMQEFPPGIFRKEWIEVEFGLGADTADRVILFESVAFVRVTAGQLALLVANPPVR